MGQSFLDQLYDENKKPLVPKRVKAILREVYDICKNIGVSYEDAMEMTPYERELMLQFLSADLEAEKKSIEKVLDERNKQ